MDDKKGKASAPIMKFWWKNAQSHFKSLLPEHITREVCRKYVKSRKDAANETVRHELGLVRAAVRWKNKNTPATFELPAPGTPRENYLTKPEFNKLLEKCSHSHLKLFLRLAIGTAGRKSAILDLTWDRVDFKNKLIRLQRGAKTSKGRAVVPMNESLCKALLESQEKATCDHVVEYGGKKVGKIDKGFREAAKLAGLDVTPHDLRRSAAIWMAEARAPMSEISSYLGHSDSRITERHYARYHPDYLRKAAEALEV